MIEYLPETHKVPGQTAQNPQIITIIIMIMTLCPGVDS